MVATEIHINICKLIIFLEMNVKDNCEEELILQLINYVRKDLWIMIYLWRLES